MFFAHSFIGLIIGWFVTLNFKNKKRQKLIIWIAAIIGSIFPDFDLAYILLIDRSASHRQLITHSLIPYILLYLVGIFSIRFFKLNKFYLPVLLAFILGVFSHLFADMFVGNIYLLNPFWNHPFVWQPFSTVLDSGFLAYLESYYMLVEILFIFLGMAILMKNFTNDHKEFRILLALLVIIQLIAWGTLIPFLI